MPTVRTNGIETYYERHGDGPAVVFVHGATLNHMQWRAQSDALRDDYTVVAYDVRGHGLTGGSQVDSYTVDLLADDLEALVAALALDRPVICGLSMGGAIAQVYAARHPERIAGLILADTFGPALRSRGERLQRSVMLRAILPLVRLVGYERVEKAMVWGHERASKGASGDYATVEALRTGGAKMTTSEFAKVMRALATFHETEVDLGAITVPTLVLYGEHEPRFIRAHVPVFAATIPDCEVTMVPGSGHASNLDDPAFFTDAVRTFLERCTPTVSTGSR